MKIERLDSNQIRVVITEADLKKLDTSVDELRPNSLELHTFLFKIMEQVKIETGFNPYNGQIMVEASPSADGVVLIVTKIAEEHDRKELQEKMRHVRAIKKKPVTKTRVYGFKEFNSLCMALKNISNELLWSSALYKMDNVYYFIVKTKAKSDRFHNVLSEFCDEYKYPVMYDKIIEEHGEIVAANDKLVQMAAEISKLYD